MWGQAPRRPAGLLACNSEEAPDTCGEFYFPSSPSTPCPGRPPLPFLEGPLLPSSFSRAAFWPPCSTPALFPGPVTAKPLIVCLSEDLFRVSAPS